MEAVIEVAVVKVVVVEAVIEVAVVKVVVVEVGESVVPWIPCRRGRRGRPKSSA